VRAVIAWVELVASTVGMTISMWLWWKDRITDRQMIGLTLALSWLALQVGALTTLFVA
jgi:hypothetical protein